MENHHVLNWDGVIVTANEKLTFWSPEKGRSLHESTNKCIYNGQLRAFCISSKKELWVAENRRQRIDVFRQGDVNPYNSFSSAEYKGVHSMGTAGDSIIIVYKNGNAIRYDDNLVVKGKAKVEISILASVATSQEFTFILSHSLNLTVIRNSTMKEEFSTKLQVNQVTSRKNFQVIHLDIWMGKLVVCFSDGIEIWEITRNNIQFRAREDFPHILAARVLKEYLVIGTRTSVAADIVILNNQNNLKAYWKFDIEIPLAFGNVDFALNKQLLVSTPKFDFYISLPRNELVMPKPGKEEEPPRQNAASENKESEISQFKTLMQKIEVDLLKDKQRLESENSKKDATISRLRKERNEEKQKTDSVKKDFFAMKEKAENAQKNLDILRDKVWNLEKENDKLRTNIMCIICTERKKECVILDCKHMVTCTECTGKVSQCPICRQPKKNVIVVYD